MIQPNVINHFLARFFFDNHKITKAGQSNMSSFISEGYEPSTEELLQDMPNEFISNEIADESNSQVASDQNVERDVHLSPTDFNFARDSPDEVSKDPPKGIDPILSAGAFEGDIVDVTSIDINELMMTKNNARNAIRNKHQLWPNGKVSLLL